MIHFLRPNAPAPDWISICRTIVEDHGGNLRLAKTGSHAPVLKLHFRLADKRYQHLKCSSLLLAHRVTSLPRSNSAAFGAKPTWTLTDQNLWVHALRSGAARGLLFRWPSDAVVKISDCRSPEMLIVVEGSKFPAPSRALAKAKAADSSVAPKVVRGTKSGWPLIATTDAELTPFAVLVVAVIGRYAQTGRP